MNFNKKKLFYFFIYLFYFLFLRLDLSALRPVIPRACLRFFLIALSAVRICLLFPIIVNRFHSPGHLFLLAHW